METEILYLGHNNAINLLMQQDGTAVDLSGTTRATMTFGDIMVESTNGTTQAITWNKAGYDLGELRVSLSSTTLKVAPGTYPSAYICLYDSANAAGIVWGGIPVIVKGQVEGAT